MQSQHIITPNFLPVSRGYFERIVRPSLSVVQKNSSPLIKTFVIAGQNVRINFYGENVFRVFSLALSHHAVASSKQADLTINVWDSSQAENPLVAPWDEPDLKEKTTTPDSSFYGVYVGGEESLNFYDEASKTAYFWTSDASLLPDWVVGAPFRTILHWFLSRSEIHLIHGAVIGKDNNSVLLTAKSGSGKSTTALACVLAGMDYLGDDYVAIEVTGDKVLSHSLYHSAKITRHGVGLFPEFEKAIWNKNFGQKEKAIMFLADLFPKQIKNISSLKAILIPRLVKGKTQIVPANKIEALLAIAPTTLLQLPMAEKRKVGVFKDILSKIPCYFLELGPDIRNIPETIKSFLKNNNRPLP